MLNYKPPITKLSFELNPENLGAVELTISKNGDKLSVQINANPNTLQLMWQNAQEFRNSLNQLGFQNLEIDFKDNAGNCLDSNAFSSGGDSGSQNNQNPQNQGQSNQNNQNFTQNTQENEQNLQSWNENSLQINKNTSNPYAKIAIVELSFSYYA